jgi:hypothetical protein
MLSRRMENKQKKKSKKEETFSNPHAPSAPPNISPPPKLAFAVWSGILSVSGRQPSIHPLEVSFSLPLSVSPGGGWIFSSKPDDQIPPSYWNFHPVPYPLLLLRKSFFWC